MAIKTFKANIKTGDAVTAPNNLKVKIYGSTDSYTTAIHTTGKFSVDSDCTLVGSVVTIINVDVGAETKFKATLIDEAGNESIVKSDIYDTSSEYSMLSIVSAWKFNGDSNDAVSGNNGTATGTSYGTDEAVGKYLNTGTDGKVIVPDSATLSFPSSAVTFGALFNFNTAPVGSVLVSKTGSTTNREYYVYFDGAGNLVCKLWDSIADNYKSITYANSFTTGVWNTVIFTDDGTNDASGLKLYLNGLSIGTPEIIGTYTGMKNGTSALWFGNHSGGTSLVFKGKIGSPFFMNEVMSAAQIGKINSDLKNGTFNAAL